MRDAIFAAINAERDRQDAEYGGPTADDQHTAETWVSICVRQLGLAATPDTANAGRHPNPAHFRRKMLQLAAVAIACVEACDRQAPSVSKAAWPTPEQLEKWKGY